MNIKITKNKDKFAGYLAEIKTEVKRNNEIIVFESYSDDLAKETDTELSLSYERYDLVRYKGWVYGILKTPKVGIVVNNTQHLANLIAERFELQSLKQVAPWQSDTHLEILTVDELGAGIIYAKERVAIDPASRAQKEGGTWSERVSRGMEIAKEIMHQLGYR